MSATPPALPSLDPLLHQPVRTQIAAYLAGRGEATFAELKRVLDVTDGNLDAHLGKLAEAGYVESRREAQPGGRPATVFSLTETGRQAFASYVATLSALLSAAPRDAAPAMASINPLPSP